MAEPKRTRTYSQRFLGDRSCPGRLSGTSLNVQIRGLWHRIGVTQCQLADTRKLYTESEGIDAHGQSKDVHFESLANTGQNTKITTER